MKTAKKKYSTYVQIFLSQFYVTFKFLEMSGAHAHFNYI